MATSSKSAKPVAKAAESTDGPKKSKKLVIILIAAVLLLVVAGGAAAFLLMGKAKNSHAAEAESQHADAEVSKTPVFVPMEPFVVNLQPETGDQFLQVSITLQVQNQETAESIKTFMPLVRSRMLLSLSSKKASELLTGDGKKKLTSEIISQINQPFSPNARPQQVSDVFYTSFVIQQQ
jgi:flagellar FliL protein